MENVLMFFHLFFYPLIAGIFAAGSIVALYHERFLIMLCCVAMFGMFGYMSMSVITFYIGTCN